MATGYHASPCRDDLARTEDGLRFATGADPQLVLDGRQYGGLRLCLTKMVTLFRDHPIRGLVLLITSIPLIENPEAGFVVSGNNDPSGCPLMAQSRMTGFMLAVLGILVFALSGSTVGLVNW